MKTMKTLTPISDLKETIKIFWQIPPNLEEMMKMFHCVNSVRIRSYSGPYFLAFGLYSVQTREYTDQNNSEYG